MITKVILAPLNENNCYRNQWIISFYCTFRISKFGFPIFIYELPSTKDYFIHIGLLGNYLIGVFCMVIRFQSDRSTLTLLSRQPESIGVSLLLVMSDNRLSLELNRVVFITYSGRYFLLLVKVCSLYRSFEIMLFSNVNCMIFAYLTRVEILCRRKGYAYLLRLMLSS